MDSDHYSQEEIDEILSDMPREQEISLVKLAKYFAMGSDYEWKDLLHEAQLRALQGRRKLSRKKDIIKSFSGIFRSIVSARAKAAKKDPLAGLKVMHDDGSDPLEYIMQGAANPEEEMINKQLLERLQEICHNNVNASMVLEAWREGYDKPDILKLFDGSEREYSSALRYIRRHISVLGGAGNER